MCLVFRPYYKKAKKYLDLTTAFTLIAASNNLRCVRPTYVLKNEVGFFSMHGSYYEIRNTSTNCLSAARFVQIS